MCEVNTATPGNVSIPTLLIIPASCECEIPVASRGAGAGVDATAFPISRSLMNVIRPHRSKLKTNRTCRTSSAWWPWPGRTPPPSPTCSPSTTSASRRLAATTRLTCKSFKTFLICFSWSYRHQTASKAAKPPVWAHRSSVLHAAAGLRSLKLPNHAKERKGSGRRELCGQTEPSGFFPQ